MKSQNCGYTCNPNSDSEERKTNRWLWVLGWIFIFPVPLTLLLLKNEKMKKTLKYGIIAAVWIIYLIAGMCSGGSNTDKTLSKIENTKQEVNKEIIKPSDEEESAEKNTISEENQTINEIENNSQEQQNIEHTPPASTQTNEKPASMPEEASSVQESGGETKIHQNEYMVWIPTNGGTKYHSRPGCSKMKNPKEVSLEQAEKNGYTPCKRCN